jgi:hypothetical protein
MEIEFIIKNGQPRALFIGEWADCCIALLMEQVCEDVIFEFRDEILERIECSDWGTRRKLTNLQSGVTVLLI